MTDAVVAGPRGPAVVVGALLAAGVVLVLGPGAPGTARAAEPTVRLIVAHADGATAAERLRARTRAHVRLDQRLRLPATEVVTVPASEARAALDRLDRNPTVRYAERDVRWHALTQDFEPRLWHLSRIRARSAWPLSAAGAGVTVAVVDTGINTVHEDLASEIAPGGRSWVQDGFGIKDRNGHGSHVSATLVGDDDGMGVVGVAPGAQVLPLRALDAGGSGTVSDIASAFDYAGAAGVRVVSASLGGQEVTQTVEAAILAHPGTLYVAAAGNDAADNDLRPTFPCNSSALNVICVGATDQADQRASFSNFGRRTVDLFAPGEDILSAWAPGPSAYFDLDLSDGDQADGTSFAVPQVSAVAALVVARHPEYSAVQVKNAVLAGVDALPTLAGLAVTGGRLDAERALTVTPADQDGDGVGNVWDDCPAAHDPGQEDGDDDGTGDACDDRDGDGVVDAHDRCVNVPASHSQDGCAATVDSDGDGVIDVRDACPTQAALGSLDGCAATRDRDGDRRLDGVDRCPTASARTASGCPLPRVRSLRAHAARCSHRRRCLRVRVVLDRAATLTVTVQRRRCTRRCAWRATLSRRTHRRRAKATLSLPERRGHRLGRGRYRVQVVPSTGDGRGQKRRVELRLR